MNTNTFEMYSNTNTLHFLQKYSNTNMNTLKMYLNTYEYEYEYILPRPGKDILNKTALNISENYQIFRMSSSSHDYFHWLDYVIFLMLLLISCGTGIYYAVKNKKGKEEYLFGNRNMSWFPVALSLVVSYTSGVTQLGKPAEIYQHGVQYVMGTIGSTLGMLFSAFTFVPLLFRLQVTSSYEVSKHYL